MTTSYCGARAHAVASTATIGSSFLIRIIVIPRRSAALQGCPRGVGRPEGLRYASRAHFLITADRAQRVRVGARIDPRFDHRRSAVFERSGQGTLQLRFVGRPLRGGAEALSHAAPVDRPELDAALRQPTLPLLDVDQAQSAVAEDDGDHAKP